MKKLLAILAAMLFVGTAQAAIVSLGSIQHLYGSAVGREAPDSQGAGSCDVLNSTSVTVRSASGCQRFYDAFDFSGLSYDSIESFVLTIDFAGARNESFGLERWAPRPASSASDGSDDTAAFLVGGGTQSWTFTSSLDLFGDIVSGQSFYLWMSREGGFGTNSLTMNSARLEVFGTAPVVGTVSSPGTLALAGLPLMFIFASRARRSQLATKRLAS